MSPGIIISALILLAPSWMWATANPQPSAPGDVGWQLKFTVPQPPESSFVYFIHFASPIVGYAVGGGDWRQRVGSAFMYKTTDGGNTWTEITSHPLYQQGSGGFYFGLDCKDLNTCWAVGRFGTLLRTLNGGASWQHAAKSIYYGGFLYSVLWTGKPDSVLVGTT